MTHPMSMPWLDWRPMHDEPRGFDQIIYLDENRGCWVGNHPESKARGVWRENGGGQAWGGNAIAWAYIPLPGGQ